MTCRHCGGSRIVTGAYTIAGEGRLSISVDAIPAAWMFKETVSSGVDLTVCGDCGAVEFFAKEPQALYKAFLRAQDKR
jgi:hypothetical protein